VPEQGRDSASKCREPTLQLETCSIKIKLHAKHSAQLVQV